MERPTPLLPELDLCTLRPIKLLGKGAMGTVLLVHNPHSDPSALHPFAVKVVEKLSSNSKPDTGRRARRELDILNLISSPNPHPFLPCLLGSFENTEFWAWAVPFCPGGDLHVLRHYQSDRSFSPAVIKFYAAEIVCVLEQLHATGIVYRDLKPENVLIQHSGHITLTDFDLSRTLAQKSIKTLIYTDSELPTSPPPQTPTRRANRPIYPGLTRFLTVNSKQQQVTDKDSLSGMKKAKSARVSPVSRRNPTERSNSFVGTEEYVSPEVIRGEGHEFSVDWWALGILLYEMLYSFTPFKGGNRKETFTNIITKEPEFMGRPSSLTDMIKRLLEKDPSRRLGFEGGASEVKEHEFFEGLRWDLLTEVVRPPFIPAKFGEDEAARMPAEFSNVMEYFQGLGTRRMLEMVPPSTPVGSPAREAGPHVLKLPEF